MARRLGLTVIGPTGRLDLPAEVAWIRVRLSDGGSIGIWPGHAPLIAETVDGPLRYSDGEGEHTLQVPAGILHVQSVGATLLIPSVEVAKLPSDTGARSIAERPTMQTEVEA